MPAAVGRASRSVSILTTPGSISDTRLRVPGRTRAEVARHGEAATADVVGPQRLGPAAYAVSITEATAFGVANSR